MANVRITNATYGHGTFTVTIVLSNHHHEMVQDILRRLDGLRDDVVTNFARYQPVSKMDLFFEELRALRTKVSEWREASLGPQDFSAHWRRPILPPVRRRRVVFNACPRQRASHRRKLRAWERS